ncbi:MAG: hypothetical protein ACYC21_11755 [Eubacteriales bacterium]
MTLKTVVNRSGNAETIIMDLGFVIKETKSEVFVVFPDGMVKIAKQIS